MASRSENLSSHHRMLANLRCSSSKGPHQRTVNALRAGSRTGTSWRHTLLETPARLIMANAATTTAPVSISIKEVATGSKERPDVGRSGAAATPLAPSHPYAALLLGGYVEHPTPEGSPQPFSRYEVMDVWGYEQLHGTWQAVTCTGEQTPPPRMAHQAITVGDYVYMIGGWHPKAGGEAQFLDDVWRLEMRTLSWSKVQPQGEQLPRISRFQAVAVGTQVYIHHHRCSDHILVMDVTHPESVTLSKVPVSGDVPPSRGMHSVTFVAKLNKLVLFGGAPQQGPMFNDLYELDLSTHVWTQITASGNTPHTRCSHTAVALPDGRHIVYHGGAYYKDEQNGGGGLQVLDDLFVYDAESHAWLWPATPDGPTPPARNAAVMVPLTVNSAPAVLLYGGWVPFTTSFNDTHILTVQVDTTR